MHAFMTVVGVVILSMTTGCGASVVSKFSKQGASYSDYLQDRQACQKEYTMRYEYARADAYRGQAESTTCVNHGMFVSCMAIKGWLRDQTNGYAPPPGGVVRGCPGT